MLHSTNRVGVPKFQSRSSTTTRSTANPADLAAAAYASGSTCTYGASNSSNHDAHRALRAVSVVTSSMLGRSPSHTKTRNARPVGRNAARIRCRAVSQRISQCKALNEVARSNSASYGSVAAVPTANWAWLAVESRRRAASTMGNDGSTPSSEPVVSRSMIKAVTLPSPHPTSSTRSSPLTTRSESARRATSCCRLLTCPYALGSQSPISSSWPRGRVCATVRLRRSNFAAELPIDMMGDRAYGRFSRQSHPAALAQW